MNQPDWLAEFPFLQSQWSEIVALQQIYPELSAYDLHSDWKKFLVDCQQSKPNDDWFVKLRQFRQSRLAYIAFIDLHQPLPCHLHTMHLVADLAELLILQAHQVASEYMVKRFGRILDKEGKSVELMVWALGKLGTRELNYSSDVDLVFLYSIDGQSAVYSDGERSLDAASYFVRLGQKMIKLLDHFTDQGQVYRVDMRLRPFGSAGPLVCSVSAFQQYIQYEGREWERFAWMRARLVSGSTEDTQHVMQSISPFIYRKHLDYVVFDALAKIKTEIAGHLDHSADDLKQGVGGIRAVEFIVQSLQLVFGGRNVDLQGVAISDQIDQVIKAGKLPAEDGNALHQAWLWLRKLENISQCVADQATHEIPDNTVIQNVMSESLDCDDWQDLSFKLSKHREKVKNLFSELFEQVESKQVLPDEQRVFLQSLMQDLSNKRLPTKRLENIEKLLQNSLLWASQSVVREFMTLVKNILTRPNYILMLLKETNVHKSVLNLMTKDRYFVRILQQYPVLLEHLFERQMHVDFSFENLSTYWNKKAPDDIEEWMEALRYFKLEHQFNLILAYTEAQISNQQTLQQMTELALFIVSRVVTYAHREMVEKLGVVNVSEDDMIVLAYGSAATNQMTEGSDMDLVFVLDIDQLTPDIQLFAQKWVRRIIHHLITPMYHGKLYELDMQLRPNGSSGALVTTKSEFAKYQAEQAWVWEHAAMVKSRAVYGTKAQKSWHQQVRVDILSQQRIKSDVEQAMQAMSKKIASKSPAKSHHSEFDILTAVLVHSREYPEVLKLHDLNDLKLKLVELELLPAIQDDNERIKKDPTK